MTTQEMIDAFLLEYDLNGSGAVAGFEDSEILSFLNKAQKKVAEDVFLQYGPSQLYSIIKIGNLQVQADAEYSNIYEGDLPSDFMFYVDSSVIITRSFKPVITIKTWVGCNLVNPDQVRKFYDSNYDTLILTSPLLYIEGDKFAVITDGDTTISSDITSSLYSVKLAYIKVPIDMDLVSQNSELSEKWHQDIVDIAVHNALKVVNDVRIAKNSNS